MNVVLRAGAQQVACPFCHAPVSAACRNWVTGEILTRPAHEPRIWAAVQAGLLVMPGEPLYADEEFES